MCVVTLKGHKEIPDNPGEISGVFEKVHGMAVGRMDEENGQKRRGPCKVRYILNN
jgi:hypothetical protein